MIEQWLKEMKALCQPDQVHICDGSKEDYEVLCQSLVKKGLFVPLSKRPNSYWCHSHVDDVARVEETTFICSRSQEDAGPTNNWRDPKEMKAHLQGIFSGCMHGRTMYVIPFSMGVEQSRFARRGIQITDSAYVAISMQIMTRVEKEFLQEPFVPCMHSVGAALSPGEVDSLWPCNPSQRVIAHFPEEPSIWSFGSGYGGNALLGKKCFALRIASVLGKKEGWLAEHMLIIGVENPQGEKRYMTAAFPSSCGKTNLAMLRSPLSGWKVTCIGDDIAWMHLGEDGRLYAMNPEFGFFGVAPGTSKSNNPYVMDTIKENTIFTNVALTPEGDVWWEGKTKALPSHLTDWLGEPWTPASHRLAAHPNARFTAPLTQCPILDPAWNDPNGVPISAIIFGGRRETLVPLIVEAKTWEQGMVFAAGLSSERTAATKGAIGLLRRDPFAMLPFCGYHMGDYFAHWLDIKQRSTSLPRIYQVNWFRKDDQGEYLWPGFGENMRVLKWIFERTAGIAAAHETAIGMMPNELDMEGLSLKSHVLYELSKVDKEAYAHEFNELEHNFAKYKPKMPLALIEALNQMRGAL